jgi:phage terminase small subunit
MARALDKLRPKQRLFLMEYAALGFTSRDIAYKRAGYTAEHAYAAATHLLARPDVEAALAELVADCCAEIQPSAERTIQELARVAYGDVRDLLSVRDGALEMRDSRTWGAAGAAVQGVKQGKFGLEVKMADKVRALDTLAKAQGLYSDSVTLDVGLDKVLERLEKIEQGEADG